MYRNQELPAAHTRAQLMHLDELNAVRIANAEYLSQELAKLPGVIPPYCPPDCRHVYFMYNVRFDPQAAGVKCAPRRFAKPWKKRCTRKACWSGNGRPCPCPRRICSKQAGLRRRGLSWAVNEAKGIKYDYRVEQYPVASMLCDTYTVVHGIHAPNGRPLMDKIVAAFHKVFGDLDAVLRHADDKVYPGGDGRHGAA